MNLWQGIIETLNIYHLTWDDVEAVGVYDWEEWSEKYRILKDDFVKIARRTDYNPGFGSAEINRFLIVTGKDWWLERHTYDGSEWWEFKKRPPLETFPLVEIPPKKLKDNNTLKYDTFEELLDKGVLKVKGSESNA